MGRKERKHGTKQIHIFGQTKRKNYCSMLHWNIKIKKYQENIFKNLHLGMRFPTFVLGREANIMC